MIQKFCAGGRWFGNFDPKKQKGICKNATKNSFPQRSIDTWNGLKEEVIKAKTIHQLQEKLNKHRYRERTTHEKLEWREVISGVPQGLVLALMMFLVYLNDMTEEVSSYISLFADNTKKMKSRIHSAHKKA